MHPKSVMFRLGSWSPRSDTDGGESDGGNATDDTFVRRPLTPDNISKDSTRGSISSDRDIEGQEETRRRREHFRYRPSGGLSGAGPGRVLGRAEFKKTPTDVADRSITSLTESESEWSNSETNSDAELSHRRSSGGDDGDVDTEEEDHAHHAARSTAPHAQRSHQRKTRSSRELLKRPAPIRQSGRACSAPSYASSPIVETTAAFSSELRHRHQSPNKSPNQPDDTPPAVDLEDPYLAPPSRFAAGRNTTWGRKHSKTDFGNLRWERSAYDGLGRYDDDMDSGALQFPTLTYAAAPCQRRSSCQCLSCSTERARPSQQRPRKGFYLSIAWWFWVLRAVITVGAATGTLLVVRAHAQLASLPSVVVPSLFSFGLAPDVLGGAVGAMRLSFPTVPNPVSAVSAELGKMTLKGERGALLERVSHSERILAHSSRGRRAQLRGVETYSVRLVASSGRPDLTKSAIESVASCRSVADVRVSTSSDGVLGGWGDVGSIVKRPGLTTDAVLTLSDDISFTCDELDRAFKVWLRQPDRIVGFFAYDLLSDSNGWSIEEVPRGLGTYSLVSDRAAFVHRAYLTSLAAKAATDASTSAGGHANEEVAGHASSPCSSFALSVAVTSVTSKPPVVVAAGPLELRNLPPSVRKTGTKDDVGGSKVITDLAAECLMSLAAAVDVRELPGEERTYVGGVGHEARQYM